MNEHYLRYNGYTDITPSGLDGRVHRFNFSVGDAADGRIESFTPTRDFHLDVGMSGTLQAVWGLSATDVSACSGTIALDQVTTSGGPPPFDVVNYTSDNAPELPPAGMNIESVHQFVRLSPTTGQTEPQTTKHPSVAAKTVTELRDNVNALFKNVYGEKLLLLESERSLVHIYYPAQNLEAFSSRVSALANLVTHVNIAFIKSTMGAGNFKDGGSIYVLEQFRLWKGIPQRKVDDVCLPMYGVNNLRQCYPVHHDTANKTVKACDYFGIRYPIEDFSQAWDVIVGKYISSLKALLSIIQQLKYGDTND